MGCAPKRVHKQENNAPQELSLGKAGPTHPQQTRQACLIAYFRKHTAYWIAKIIQIKGQTKLLKKYFFVFNITVTATSSYFIISG